MREEGGYEGSILPALELLGGKHQEHIAAYGEDNHERLTGLHETSSMDKYAFSATRESIVVVRAY